MVNTENLNDVIDETKEAFENLSDTQIEKVEEIINDPKLSIYGKLVAVFAVIGLTVSGVGLVYGGYRLIKWIKSLIEKKKAKKMMEEEPTYREIKEEETEEPEETTEE